MKAKVIIRIEQTDGLGLFQYKFYDAEGKLHRRKVRVAAMELPDMSERHCQFNDPWNDCLDIERDNKEWFCAYKSARQFKQWITSEEIRQIIEMGYRVFVLEVSEYQEGKDQIIYTKDSIVKSQDVTELFLQS